MVGLVQHGPSGSRPRAQRRDTGDSTLGEAAPLAARAKKTIQADRPLSAAEAELAGRVSQLVRRRPKRSDPVPREATSSDRPDHSEVEVLPHIDRDPFEASCTQPLPAFPDEPEPATGERTVRTITWLHRSRRARFRSRLREASAWLVTLAVIALTIGVAFLVLFGADKSLALAHIARDEFARGWALVVSAAGQILPR
jgi:hypothetical protein